MAGSFSVTSGNTTVNFSYTTTTVKVQAIVTDAAEWLWNHGYGDHGTAEVPILFSSLTNQQKLNLVDAYVKQVIIDTANTNKSVKAQDTARATEEASKHVL